MSAPDPRDEPACMIAMHPAAVRVLVVGGGPVAARKAAPYLAAGARLRIIAPHLCEALEAAVATGVVALERRAYAAGDVGDAQIVFAATGSPDVNRRVAEDADAAHRLVNVADDSAPSAFSSSAQIERGPLVIGVYAGGVPDVARRVRDLLAARLGIAYGDAARWLGTVRRHALDAGDRASWDRARRELVGDDFCVAVDDGTFSERAATWR